MPFVRSIIKKVTSLFTKKAEELYGVPRSGEWSALRARTIALSPRCAWCGGKTKLEVHHIVPFWVDKSKELDPENLIVLCMDPERECHFKQGHNGISWRSYNLNIKRECAHRHGKVC